jgi:hypothetical protein
MPRFFLNGQALTVDGTAQFAGAAVMKHLGKSTEIPQSGEPPYSFCGNGAGRAAGPESPPPAWL